MTRSPVSTRLCRHRLSSPTGSHGCTRSWSAGETGLAGKVFLEVVIGVDSSVSHVVVLKMTEGAEWLAGTAVEAMRQWRYRPATTADGQHPVPVLFNIAMTFTLNDDDNGSGPS
ncbi:MAG: energy transducer TonB [Acidobacteriota bacterium]